MSKRGPNVALARLLDESGLSETQFIRAVNRLAAEAGVSVRYDQPSVSQWRGGTVPRLAVRPFIAEVLARRLGRPVTLAEIGFPTPRSTPDNRTFPRTVDELVDLVRSDMDPSRRGVLSAGLYSVALTIPAWPNIVGRMEAVRSGQAQRIGMADVEAVSMMTDRLSELDDHFGGRYARPMAAAFMANTVAPFLSADASSDARKAILSAASFLCYLTDWMAVDEGLHGLAQRYYVKGLELAGASGDHSTYCHILRGMSVQAADLGHGETASRLANASAAVSPTSGYRMRAFLSGQQAHSYAVAGDRSNALRSIRETEIAMDKAESQPGTFGGYNPATLAYHVAQVRYGLGDVAGSVASIQLHFRLRDATDSRRSGLRFSAVLAERQLEIGHIEAACATWNRVLDEYPTVHSGRVDERVSKINSLLRPHRSNAAARELYERARNISAHRRTKAGT
ncbi:tetratricopeptide repeat protein [Streptomyces sp. SID8382]|uniref:transcriptional regulator n=1 Tax=Streptomyces malaysiensis TaxID=92644 RepID=UPI000C2C6232|nr:MULTISPECIES: transcriptional regulator [unclassified Streptomyces]AUA11461.1 55.5 kDa and 49.5 kDa sporulation protein [Streptomyces sp. M56]MYX59816.1 tetratricopeptide repeat protein [Streptomyces sp. SID8382]